MKRLILATAIALILGRVTYAGDGVTDLKINPAAGVSITTPGSYRLVSDVTMTANFSAIVLSANDITLDLGGHTITGSGAASTVVGIGGITSRHVITNGRVTGFGMWGIQIGAGSRIENITADQNNKTGDEGGILTGDNSIVKNCIARNNTPTSTGEAAGISVGANSIVEDCVAEDNDSPTTNARGIRGLENVTVTNCSASFQTGPTTGSGNGIGISVGEGGVVRDCVANGNNGGASGMGISAGIGSVVRDSACDNNDSNGAGSGYGILVERGSLVSNNTCHEQSDGPAGKGTAVGISTGNDCTIIGNVCHNNTGVSGSNPDGNGTGISAGNDCLVKDNHCNDNDGIGTGNGIGISMSLGCKVEGNRCADHFADTGLAYGLLAAGGCVLIGNHTEGNSDGGINAAGTGNYLALNHCNEALPLNTGDDVVGTGDNQNVTF